MELIAQFGLFNGILVLLLIVVYSFRRSPNRIFLGVSIFFVWYTLLLVYLTVTRQILNYPFLHRTGIITAYLAFPLLYIYSRNTFYPGKMWRKTDWILLLPAFIYVIDFMPFFLKPTAEKISILRENLASDERMFTAGEGWIGLPGIYFPFIYIWIAIIICFQFHLIIINRKLENGFKSLHNRRLFNFIVTITFLYLPLFIPGIFGILFKLSWFNPGFVGLSYAVSLSTVCFYLFFSPKILYGFIPEMKFRSRVVVQTGLPEIVKSNSAAETLVEGKVKPAKQPSANDKTSNPEPSEMEQEIAAELAIVLRHMKDNKPYLKQGFTIQDLSNQTSIPVYQLSPLINNQIGMNFSNWVNKYRIEYFIEQFPENPQLTLEALSKKSGFISRSTFINAFKKEKGTTPREYFKSLNLST